MNKPRCAPVIALVLTLVGFCAVADASVIREYTAGTINRIEQYPGESFSTPSGGPWNNITFNRYVEENGARTPAAFGTLFLLTQEYLGTPAGLSPSTPGCIAHADSPGGIVYAFDPALTLLPDQTYYFYANSFNVIYGGGDDAGATFYTSGRGDIPFVQFTTVDADYRLSGDVIEGGPGVPAPVPEPSALALIVLGTVGLLGAARSRRDIPPA